MMRVTTLYASTASATAQYYTRYLTQADGEQPGQWAGRQAWLLGLAGEVTTEQLEALLEGRDPISGTPLGSPLVDRYTSSGKLVRAVAGFDATLSTPKSLSVWWALTGDEGLAECHDVAVAAVVDLVERYGSTTRVRSNGRRLHPDSHGLTVAVFRQTTSRLDDPQLHSHVVISAKVQTVEGRWLALDARVLKGFQRALGGVYQSVLRAELTARYGVSFGPIVNGQAEIAGVPHGLLEVFSKRTAQVDGAFQAKLAEFWGREGRDPTPKERGALGREAAIDTRSHKTGHGVPDLRSRWQVEAATIGITPASLDASIRDAARQQPPTRQQVAIADVVSAVGERRSAWHRFDVLQAICDTVRPQPGLDGTRWAHALERATDTVIESCVDLDPTDTHSRRRGSDGRSVWIEPVARHHTSREILAQEDHIITWALDHQHTPPTTSTTVNVAGLDAMQAEAAAVVAGHDRLVLVVGPAGAGKTTMLHAAAVDLTAHRREVFGLAPTAKAARVLETGTSIGCDTVAKLLHEHARSDRPPGTDWQLPAGATVIVDEAGMLATPDLHRLSQLSDLHRWRLVLVGDPHQLQAVGRGGMFAELCATGRTIELDHIHRFTNAWEAAASLKLRHGDPTGLDAYFDHDRIFAAPFAEHVDNIALAWAGAHERGEYLAITTTTNDHVHAINRAVQVHRQHVGQLGDHELELGDTILHVGDVVATRRNQRLLRTTTGEPVRNRDYWTINTVTADGGVTVTRIDGHGTVTLPAGYVRDHVQLGYAATEPGNQSDTADRSITLATPATTCRGLYVAVTRGRDHNLICVTTDTHDITDAIDVLGHILATDRADHPAIHTRRELAGSIPPAPALVPRCSIPDWVHDLRHDARHQLADAQTAVDDFDQRATHTAARLAAIGDELRELAPLCAPHDRAIATVRTDLDRAEQRHRAAARELTSSGPLHRRAARATAVAAADEVTTAHTELNELTRRAQPLLDQRSALRGEHNRLHDHLTHTLPLARRLNRTDQTLTETRHLVAALDTLHNWAAGEAVPPAHLVKTARILNDLDDPHAALAKPLANWLDRHHIAPTQATRPQHDFHPMEQRFEPPGLDIGL